MSLSDHPVSANPPAPGAANPPSAPSPGPISSQDWQPGGVRLEWERWKLREDPRRSGKLILLGVVLLLVGVVLVMSLPITAAVALGLALVATLSPYLLPRRFEVGEEGVMVRQGFYATRGEWSEFENYQKVTQGYLLRTRPKEGMKPPRSNRLFPKTDVLFLPFPLESEKLPILEATLLRHIP